MFSHTVMDIVTKKKRSKIMKEKYKNEYRFIIKNKNNYVINQHLASVHADPLEE